MFGLFRKKPPSIFVQIASYRDTECQWTVKDLFENAEMPERVHVGICWQCDLGLDKDCFVEPYPRPRQVREITVHPSETKGVCWARAQVQTLFHDEDYVLMIDSHMRFIKGWDKALIEELARCGSEKPILSGYPPGYTPPDVLEQSPRPVVMVVKQFNEKGALRMNGEKLEGEKPEKPLRGAFMAGGFIFASGKFVREVPYDPHLYFDHEEIMLAARAYTHGWNVYHSPETFLYHYYNDQKGPARPTHWADNPDWAKFHRISHARYDYLLAGVTPEKKEALEEMEEYGLGKARSLAEFEAFTGLDFKNKVASGRALKGGFIEGLDRYRRKPALSKGGVMPPLKVADEKGELQDIPPPCIVCLLPKNSDAYMKEFFESYEAKEEGLNLPLVFILQGTANEASAARDKYNIPQSVLADKAGAIWKLFGRAGKPQDPYSVALDAEGRIKAFVDNRNAANHMGDLLRITF